MEEQIKIHIEKDDELPVIAERVFSADAREIILIVPKFSKLAESVDNFTFLKKGLADSNKTLIIESVDDKVIKLSTEVKLVAQNPFFTPPDTSGLEPPKASTPADDQVEEEESSGERIGDNVFNTAEKELEKSFKRPSRKIKPGVLLVVLFLVVGLWTGFKTLPRAEINIVTQKFNREFSEEIIVDKNAVADDLKNLKIPGQIFTQNRNGQMTFPASGRKTVNQKAKGKILVYNAYSSKPQPLVATTRFQAPNGKIVRLDKAITVPGAKIIDNKIVPSFIEASVTADKVGESYNIGPLARLTVPGFKGSPKYNGFYGELKSSLAGGYVGERAFPTADEIENSKGKGIASLKNSLEVLMSSQVPQDFKVLKGASQFTLVKEEINTRINDKNEFSIFTEVKLAVMGFREKDILAVFESKIKEEFGDDFKIKSGTLNYKLTDADIDKGKLTLSVDFKVVVSKPIAADLKLKIAGKSETDLKATIFGLSGLESAQISLWPFWVNKVPINQKKIKINVD